MDNKIKTIKFVTICMVCIISILCFVKVKVLATEKQSFRILEISERTFENSPAIAILFSDKLKSNKRYDNQIRISDKKKMLKSAWVLSDDSRTLYYPYLTPKTKYSVTVSEDILSAEGIALGKRVSRTIKTRAMPSVVSFKGEGLLLPAKMTSGLPVITVNVESVDIEFFKMNDKGLTKFVSWKKPYQNKGYYQLENIKKYAKLVFSGRFNLEPEKNSRVTRYISVENIKALQKPGVYMAVMRQPGEYSFEYQTTFFIVTDLGLQARVYPDEARIYASSLKTGKILSNVDLTFLNKTGKTILKGKINKKGVYKCSKQIIKKTSVVIARYKKYQTALSFSVPALDLSEFNLGKRVNKTRDIFIYSPRDLYRPGETVTMAALLRNDDASKVESIPLFAQYIRPDGLVVKEFMLQPKKKLPGFYKTQFSIPLNAQTGNWRFELRVIPDSKTATEKFNFHVEDFLPERMKLELTSPQKYLTFQSELFVDIKGSYLYGAPASDNKVLARVIVKPARELYKKLKGFKFGNIADKNYIDNWDVDEIHLDKNGEKKLKIQNHWKNLKSPMTVRTTVSLFESGGRPVVRSIKTIYRPAKNLVGILPMFNVKSTEPGLLKFKIAKVTPNGTLVSSNNLLITIIKEDRNYFWEFSQNRGWDYNYTEKRYTYANDAISILDKTPFEYSTNLPYGRYIFKIKDPETNLVTSIRFHVGYWSDDDGKKSAARPDIVKLNLDKKAYYPNDIIKLTVKPPHAGHALILIESDKLLWSVKTYVKPSGTVIKIPVSNQWKSHDIYISAVVFRPGSASEKITPNRAIGLVYLPLEREKRRISFSINSPEKIKPLQKIKVQLKLDENSRINAEGEPLFVTLSAVDMGILNITNFKTPDPFSWFFEQRRFDVDIYDIYGKVIEIADGKLAKLRYGGDADITPGGKRPETKVELVSLFCNPVMFDKNGEAYVELNIPDFNGKLRLMAVAFSSNMVGSSEKDMTVAASVITQLSMPRFLAPLDQSEFMLDIRNMTDKNLNLEIDFNVTSPVIFSDNLNFENHNGKKSIIKTVNFNSHEKKTLRFPVVVENKINSSIIKLKVKADNVNIQKQWLLGIRPAYPATVRKQSTILKKEDTFTIDKTICSDMIPSTVEIDVRVSSTLSLNMKAAIKGLLGYPYGCAEQTVSQAFPFVYINFQTIKRFDLPEVSKEKKMKLLKKAVEKLHGLQLSSGGFGLWSRQSPEDAWLTVYVTDFLLSANNASIFVPASLLAKAINRVKEYLVGKIPEFGNGLKNKKYEFTVKCYAAYLMSKLNKAPLGTLRILYDNYKENAVSPLPLVQLGVAFAAMGDHNRSKAAFGKAVQKKYDDCNYYSDYGTAFRDDALSTFLLVKSHASRSDLMSMIKRMENALSKKEWLSTQEKYALFRAGMALSSLDEKVWNGVLTVAGDNKTISRKDTLILTPSVNDIKKGVSFTSNFDNNLFVSAVINGYTTTSPPMDNKYISIKRSYYNLDGHPIYKRSFPVGELILVHLKVISDRRVPDAIVVDLFPAGFEAENLNLTQGINLDDLRINGKSITTLLEETNIVYEEYRDDRYVAALKLEKNQKTDLFYLARVVSPGKYTVPQTFVESMYNPEIRGIGEKTKQIEIGSSYLKE